MLTKQDNRVINLLFITSILLFFNLGPASISFPVGIYVLLRLWKKAKVNICRRHIILLFLLFIVGAISCIFSPVPFTVRKVYFLTQYIYWLLLACMIGELYPYINKKSLSKSIAISSLVLGIANLFFGLGTQNSVAFTLVILGPIGIYGFRRDIFKLIYSLTILMMMLFNESRSGLAILSVELVLVSVKYFSSKYIKYILILSVVGFGLFLSNMSLRTIVADIIEPYNEEMAVLLKDSESVMLQDKSWLQRRLQVQKGIQIFSEYPVMGIGFNNFTPMDVNIDLNVFKDIDANLLRSVAKTSDNRSSHNSYISLLAETGVVGFICFVLFVLVYLITALKRIKYLDEFDFLVFITVFGLLVYLYTISALYGTSVWLFYGFIYGYVRHNMNKYI